ncbi:MAG: NADH-quinone oxidoreductase subunit J [Candidatus Sericytochromatia bacterium]|nr:NADH-quinone oxidoreductase subunit J [Candidatus Sericytochromatia bacterium]
MSPILFYFLAFLAIVAGLVTITRRHPLSAALSLVVCFAALAGLYGMLAARLLAMLQILVYAGAIMALVVFVIMLLNVRWQDLDMDEPITGNVLATLAVVIPLFGLVVIAIKRLPIHPMPAITAEFGGVHEVGMALYTRFAFPFEAISLLLMAALVGVVVLAKRRFT